MTVFTVEKPNALNYQIDGQPDPTLELVRGKTYTFDFVDNGHPFFIKSSLASGTSGRYDTGVENQGSSSADADLVFTVPEDAPDVLYYQCSVHPAMNGQLLLTSDETPEQNPVTESTVRVIVDPPEPGVEAFLLEGVTEVRSADGGRTLEYNGVVYDYDDLDADLTVVTRDDAFTEEFAVEITEAIPYYQGISFSETVDLVGSSGVNNALLAVAQADGNSVG